MQQREIIIGKYGAAEAMQFRNFAESAPKRGEVRIDVRYSGINFADIQMRLGYYPDAPPKPFVPGYEVSGIVSALGEGVSKVKVGDEVVAGCVFGGYSSQIVLPQENVFPLPKSLDLKESAAVPVNFFTAEMALNEMGRIRSGDRIMIDCATGGVGTLAIQMARAIGVEEIVGLTSSPAKKAYIDKLGARGMTREEFYRDTSCKDFDFVLNASGGAEIKKQMPRMRIGGRMVCLGMNSGSKDGKRNIFRMLKAVVQTPRISVLKLFGQNQGIFALNALHVMQDPYWIAKLGHAFSRLDEASLAPHVGEVFPAEKVAEAHAFLQTRKAVGKVLLEW